MLIALSIKRYNFIIFTGQKHLNFIICIYSGLPIFCSHWDMVKAYSVLDNNDTLICIFLVRLNFVRYFYTLCVWHFEFYILYLYQFNALGLHTVYCDQRLSPLKSNIILPVICGVRVTQSGWFFGVFVFVFVFFFINHIHLFIITC